MVKSRSAAWQKVQVSTYLVVGLAYRSVQLLAIYTAQRMRTVRPDGAARKAGRQPQCGSADGTEKSANVSYPGYMFE